MHFIEYTLVQAEVHLHPLHQSRSWYPLTNIKCYDKQIHYRMSMRVYVFVQACVCER